MQTKGNFKWIVMMLLLVVTISGCGKKEELQPIPSTSLDEVINMEEEVVQNECPEGYVYDYQISMEPIPEEIAALGGDVCGTIHAYPTKISVALAKQEIENDIELQKENEKNIEGVQRYLDETYGGEFEIEPLDTVMWGYMCTEKGTGKSFGVYISTLYSLGLSDEAVDLDTYFYEDNAKEYNDEIDVVLYENLQDSYVFKTRLESVDELKILYIKIAVFKDSGIDYIDEQQMIIELFDRMQELTEKKDISLVLNISYFPLEYQDVIFKQYQSNNMSDMT